MEVRDGHCLHPFQRRNDCRRGGASPRHLRREYLGEEVVVLPVKSIVPFFLRRQRGGCGFNDDIPLENGLTGEEPPGGGGGGVVIVAAAAVVGLWRRLLRAGAHRVQQQRSR